MATMLCETDHGANGDLRRFGVCTEKAARSV